MRFRKITRTRRILRAVIALAALYGFLASVSHVYLDHLGDSLSAIEDLARAAAHSRVSCDQTSSGQAVIQESERHRHGHSHDGDDHTHPLLCHRGKEDSRIAPVLKSEISGDALLSVICASYVGSPTSAYDWKVPPKAAGPHYLLHRSLLI